MNFGLIITILFSLDVSSSNYNVTVGGNWSNSDGFKPHSGTVTLNGTNQSISGSTSFYNLTKQNTGGTLTFETGKTQTIQGALTLVGTNTNPISLRASGSDRWQIDPQGSRTIAFLNVKSGDNINPTLVDCTNGCFDSGNNIGFLFNLKSDINSATLPLNYNYFLTADSFDKTLGSEYLEFPTKKKQTQMIGLNTDEMILLLKELYVQKKYTQALNLVEPALDNDRDYDLSRLNVALSDDVVKVFYIKGNLRQAILRRKQSLLYFEPSSLNNRIVELWYLQDLYRQKVGKKRYLRDREVSSQVPTLDQTTQEERNHAIQRLKGFERQAAEHELKAWHFYSIVSLKSAEQEYKKALIELFLSNSKSPASVYQASGRFRVGKEKLNKILGQLKTPMSDIAFQEKTDRENLLNCLALQGRYLFAIQEAQRLQKLFGNEERYGKTIQTLTVAKEKVIDPSELAYPDPSGSDTMEFRDKNYNRLISEETLGNDPFTHLPRVKRSETRIP